MRTSVQQRIDELFNSATEWIDTQVLKILRSPPFLNYMSLVSSVASRIQSQLDQLRDRMIETAGVASRRDTDRILHLLERIEAAVCELEERIQD